MPVLNRRRNFNTPIAAAVQRLFESGEQGAVFTAYNPDKVVKRRNVLTYSDNGLTLWTKLAAPTITQSGGTVDGITADRIDTTAASSGVYRTVVATATYIGQEWSMQARIKHVSGDSTTWFRLEGAAFATPVGVKIDPTTGAVTLSTTAPANSTVTPTSDGGWLVSFTAAAQVAGAINVVVYSAVATARSVLVTAIQVEQGRPTAYQPVTDWNTEYLGGTPVVRRNLYSQTTTFGVYWYKAAAPTISAVGDYTKITATAAFTAINQTIPTAEGQQFTVSVKAKYVDQQYLTIVDENFGVSGALYMASFDLTNGVITNRGANVTATITPLPDGGYLCTRTTSVPAGSGVTQTNTKLWLGPYSGNSFAGTSILLKEPQYELGPIATASQAVTDWTTELAADQAARDAVLSQIGMWQDATGTTPVTAVEQPVGMWLDGRGGKTWIRGRNVALNGTFDTDLSNWSNSSGAWTWDATGKAKLTGDGTLQELLQLGVLTTGMWYEFSFDVSTTVGAIGIEDGTGVMITSGSSGTVRGMFKATNGNYGFKRVGGAVTGTIDNVVVRQIASGFGNHATQVTSAARPVLCAKHNLLQYTEQFTNPYWSAANSLGTDIPVVTDNFSTAPNGTRTAARVVVSPAIPDAEWSLVRRLNVGLNLSGGQTIRYALWVKATDASQIGKKVNLYSFGPSYNNVGTLVLTADWQRFVVDQTFASATTSQEFSFGKARAGVVGGATQAEMATDFLVWGADARFVDGAINQMPPYQRVSAITDYDTAGFPHYLRFDGVDDKLLTAAFAGTGSHHTMMTAFRHLGGGTPYGSVVDWGLSTPTHYIALYRSNSSAVASGRVDTDAAANQTIGATPAFDGGTHITRLTVNSDKRTQVDSGGEAISAVLGATDFADSAALGLGGGAQATSQFANIALYGAVYLRSAAPPGSFDNYRKTLAKLAGMA